LGENVVVGAGAKVLGNIQIGDRVRIGAGSVVLRTVPSDCTVVGVPGRIVHRSGERVDPLEHGRLPDSEAQVIRALVDRIESLEQQIQLLHTKPSLNESLLLVSAVATTANGSNGTNGNGSYVANQPNVSADETSRSCRIRDKVIEEFLDGAGI
jgi:serine O-acetyltransferase